MIARRVRRSVLQVRVEIRRDSQLGVSEQHRDLDQLTPAAIRS